MQIKDLLHLTKINEVDPNTLSGSLSSNLDACREYSLDKLKQIKNKFDTIYILGSWYGNLSMMIERDNDISFDRIINVEIDREVLETGQEIINSLGYEFIEPMLKDANDLNYMHLEDNGLIINQSCTNIKGDNWFKNIPSNTTVLLTARNNDPGAVTKFNSIYELAEKYPLSKILYAGKKQFTDRETDYDYYLLIGIK